VRQARDLLTGLEDARTRAKVVLRDRDAGCTAAFGSVFQAGHQGYPLCGSGAAGEFNHGTAGRRLPPRTVGRTLAWNQRHLMIVLRGCGDFCDTRRPHRTLDQAAPLRPLLDGVTGLDQFRVQRRGRAGGVIHEYHLVA
jgi:putative transposase